MAATRLLVFDLDGTLVDSAPDIAASCNRMLAARGLPPQSDSDVAGMVGDGVHKLMERLFAAAGGTPDAQAAADYLSDYEANVAVRTRLFPGIAASLTALDGTGWRLAICTNKPERATRLLLEKLGLDGRFAAIGGGDSFPSHKPDPRHLAATIAQAGSVPEGALMVGDHTNDVRAAAGCGVPAVFAGWGYGRPGMEQGAAAIAATPADLPAIANRLLA